MTPSHAAPTPIVARNAGRTVAVISCDQSLKSEASPIPSTVRFNQEPRRLPVSFMPHLEPPTAR